MKTKKITIDGLAGMMNTAFKAMDGKFDKVNEKLDKIDYRLDVIEGKNFNNHENRITHLEDDVRKLKVEKK